MAIVTRRDTVANVGTYGWDGGLGTNWRNDPREQLITILMTQQAWAAPEPPRVARDFWTLAYQAIDD
jgi:CubicO group peptidase (beta-lactamase class C family)